MDKKNKNIMELTKQFIKKETVLVIAGILALLSMFVTPPSGEYISYIDFRTLGLLWCLMAVVSGFRKMGIFDNITNIIVRKGKNLRQLTMTMILLCFFVSMLVTNDVALLTIVPITIMILTRTNKSVMISTIVLETIAANLGSMFTPIGNPQNLYLYTQSGMDIIAFIRIMAPYTLLSLLLLLISSCIIPRQMLQSNTDSKSDTSGEITGIRLIMYVVLFALCLLCVLHILDYKILLIVVFICIAVLDTRTLLRPDYMLLLTFIAFFVLIGNIKNIDVVHNMLERVIEGRTVITSIVASQVISNVPAAVLLSGFTSDYTGLIIGTNLGGLGTLIASMASLISYKFYAAEADSQKGRYLLVFTVMNVIFLAALCILYMIMTYLA